MSASRTCMRVEHLRKRPVVHRARIVDGFDMRRDVAVRDGRSQVRLDLFDPVVRFMHGPVTRDERMEADERTPSGLPRPQGVVRDPMIDVAFEKFRNLTRRARGQRGVQQAGRRSAEKAPPGPDDVGRDQQRDGGIQPAPSRDRDEAREECQPSSLALTIRRVLTAFAADAPPAPVRARLSRRTTVDRTERVATNLRSARLRRAGRIEGRRHGGAPRATGGSNTAACRAEARPGIPQAAPRSPDRGCGAARSTDPH